MMDTYFGPYMHLYQLSQDGKSLSILIQIQNNYKWELAEVDDPMLPTGQNHNYRIRTLLGQALGIDELSGATGRNRYKVKLQETDKAGEDRHVSFCSNSRFSS